MFKVKGAFSSFSIKDQAETKKFYSEILGLEIEEDGMGLELKVPGGKVFMYTKEAHEPATFTVLNFVVEDIDQAVDDLMGRGVKFERYEGMPADEKGILRGIANNRGPDIAWFKDPSGNILSVLQAA